MMSDTSTYILATLCGRHLSKAYQHGFSPCVSEGLQKNRPTRSVEREKEIYFKELAHTIVSELCVTILRSLEYWSRLTT